MPLRHQQPLHAKDATLLTLPFFDDFSAPAISFGQWDLGGAYVNQGYAPLPPTVGMVTLDAFDAEGELYPTALGQTFGGDTLTSYPIRLDSIFTPYPRKLTADDSVYISFFYMPGGGYGNMWERVGDVPEEGDSLVLEFNVPGDTVWHHVWESCGQQADSLFAHSGNYWQFVNLHIADPRYLQKGFRFRFRNHCSLDNVSKRGLLSNADQWNIDYVHIAADRSYLDSISRDVAFVNPAPSLLKHYQAMPAKQYVPSEMKDSLALTIANLYSDELAINYGYTIRNQQDEAVHTYVGGFENAPVYWRGHQYQTAPVHARPELRYAFPMDMQAPAVYTVVHGLREGVSGDAHTQNDTVRFVQTFDNYYAYDDGTAENGYGITSTSSRVRLCCQFNLNVEDTLTALNLYFNRTLNDENEEISFYLTVWDDAGGRPGNIIYQDQERRRPLFRGLNQFVRYELEEPLVCSGTVYIGLEQTTADYINLGFDRNNDASNRIFFLTSANWQTSILRGALMLRPYFGQLQPLSIDSHMTPQFEVYAQNGRITITPGQPGAVAVFDLMGRVVYRASSAGPQSQIITPSLPGGVYLVRVGFCPAKKVVVL